MTITTFRQVMYHYLHRDILLILCLSNLLSIDLLKVRSKTWPQNNILLGYPAISSTPSHGSDGGSKFIPTPAEGTPGSLTIKGAAVACLLGAPGADASICPGAPGILKMCALVKRKK